MISQLPFPLSGRMSKRVGGAIQAALEKAGHEVCLIDPGTLDLPILQTPLHFYPGKN